MKLTLAMVAAGLLAGNVVLAQVPSKPGDWPQWRGPNRDGISLETGLLREWPKEGPAVVWQVDSVGVGYSSLSLKDGRIFTQGDLDGVEHVIALDATDGKTVWAVQPGPAQALLAERLNNEMKGLDRNKDGVVDELEALQRFGWEFNRFDKAAGGDVEARAKARAEALFARLDQDGNGKLTVAEAGGAFGNRFEQIDAEDKEADAAALAASRTADYIKTLDKDNDGKLSKKEAGGTLSDRQFGRIDQKDAGTGKGDDQLTAEEIEAGLVKHEKGRDGVLSQAELVAFYANNKPAGDGNLTLEELRGPFGGFRIDQGDGPRGTPTVDGNRVYAEGANGDLTCLDGATGKTIWHVSLTRDYGGGQPHWGYSESPLIVGELVIVTPGGKNGTVAALDKQTGNVVWKSGELTEGAHYSSPVLATVGGVEQIIQFSNSSVFGVSLKDGKFLWRYKKPANGTANCCAPIVDQDHVFASSAYGTGGGLAKITISDDKFTAEEVYFENKLACHHGGIVKIGNWMYSNGGGALICMDFLSGKTMWQNRSVGKGSVVAADGMLYLLSEGHEVALADASPGEYVEKGRFKIKSHGRSSWAHPVVAGGRLYIRDQESLTAYDVRAK